jgi:heptose-I-phosphate ethanolaminephosphotransferase
MGSHLDYKLRYPDKWNHFNESDYPELNDFQKKVIASYDNSILYNDYVVSEILKCFESEETLALYFSDHGQDLFESSDDYYGHALKGNHMSEFAATQIPFVAYMSPKYQENFPNETNWLKLKKSGEMNTGNTIEFMCEVLGVSLDN